MISWARLLVVAEEMRIFDNRFLVLRFKVFIKAPPTETSWCKAYENLGVCLYLASCIENTVCLGLQKLAGSSMG
jgi:hypothetical protein